MFWIDASSESSIDLRLRQIAKANNAPPQATSSAASALNWISGKENWFVIYDNADGGYQVVEKFLPPGDGGTILITSRNKDLMRITLKENSMEVLEMEEEEALLLLAKSAMIDYTSQDVKDQAQKLISKLGGIPLAIDQAGAYMLACNHSLVDYLELFIKYQDQLMSDPLFMGASDYGFSTYGTWEISMKEIEARASGRGDHRAIAAESAIILHKIFAFLHYESIPEELFRNAAENYNKRDIDEEKEYGFQLLITLLDAKILFLNERKAWNKLQFQAGIQVLLSFSLIRSSGKMYSIHPLVHSWSRDRIFKSETDKQHLIAKALLSCSVDLYDCDNYEFCGFLVPHIRASNRHAAEMQLTNDYYDDESDRFSLVFRHTGNWNEAENLQMQVMDMRKAKLGPGHRHTLLSMWYLSHILWDQERWDEVEKLNVQIIETSGEKLHADLKNPFILGAMSNLAASYQKQGRTDEAEMLGTKIMEVEKKNLGPHHLSTLSSMESLATTYIIQNRFVEAEQLLLQVLEVRKATLGSNHYDTLSVMYNLADAYHNQGKWDAAEKLELHVFEAYKVKLGLNHPETLDSMGKLGSTYRNQGRVDEAHVLLFQAVRQLEQTIGPQHPTTLWFKNELEELPNEGA
jgi:tetratricopeptide (TPR) repeat protein